MVDGRSEDMLWVLDLWYRGGEATPDVGLDDVESMAAGFVMSELLSEGDLLWCEREWCALAHSLARSGGDGAMQVSSRLVRRESRRDDDRPAGWLSA